MGRPPFYGFRVPPDGSQSLPEPAGGLQTAPKACQSLPEAAKRLPAPAKAYRRPPNGFQSEPKRRRSLQTAPRACQSVPEASQSLPDRPKSLQIDSILHFALQPYRRYRARRAHYVNPGTANGVVPMHWRYRANLDIYLNPVAQTVFSHIFFKYMRALLLTDVCFDWALDWAQSYHPSARINARRAPRINRTKKKP